MKLKLVQIKCSTKTFFDVAVSDNLLEYSRFFFFIFRGHYWFDSQHKYKKEFKFYDSGVSNLHEYIAITG